jgi:hypothetical protein
MGREGIVNMYGKVVGWQKLWHWHRGEHSQDANTEDYADSLVLISQWSSASKYCQILRYRITREKMRVGTLLENGTFGQWLLHDSSLQIVPSWYGCADTSLVQIDHEIMWSRTLSLLACYSACLTEISEMPFKIVHFHILTIFRKALPKPNNKFVLQEPSRHRVSFWVSECHIYSSSFPPPAICSLISLSVGNLRVTNRHCNQAQINSWTSGVPCCNRDCFFFRRHASELWHRCLRKCPKEQNVSQGRLIYRIRSLDWSYWGEHRVPL